ncbi:MAG: MBL fold metallo-hydrolase [Pseudomonadota bacterium]
MADDPFRRDHHVTPGAVETLAPGIRAVTAENAGPMTFTGTRSYFVGEGEVALIDPGPDDPRHLGALMKALGPDERITHILVTHSHLDHSPLAPAMAALSGAPVLAFGPTGAGRSEVMERLAKEPTGIGGGEGIDRAFTPDRTLADGEEVAGKGWRLRALHTPGHFSNHMCFAWEERGAVFSGDHVMGWATTLVSPPDGDLTAFMASLAKMRARGDDRVYYPGHGAPVEAPHVLIDHIRTHREGREAAILAALEAGPATVADLVITIYADIDRTLHPAAGRNVLAHLIDLMERGEVAAGDGPIGGAVFTRAA